MEIVSCMVLAPWSSGCNWHKIKLICTVNTQQHLLIAKNYRWKYQNQESFVGVLNDLTDTAVASVQHLHRSFLTISGIKALSQLGTRSREEDLTFLWKSEIVTILAVFYLKDPATTTMNGMQQPEICYDWPFSFCFCSLVEFWYCLIRSVGMCKHVQHCVILSSGTVLKKM